MVCFSWNAVVCFSLDAVVCFSWDTDSFFILVVYVKDLLCCRCGLWDECRCGLWDDCRCGLVDECRCGLEDSCTTLCCCHSYKTRCEDVSKQRLM